MLSVFFDTSTARFWIAFGSQLGFQEGPKSKLESKSFVFWVCFFFGMLFWLCFEPLLDGILTYFLVVLDRSMQENF